MTERAECETEGRPEDAALPESPSGLRWLVMQSLRHQKWVLAVVRGTFEEYCVTDVMSENVDLMVQCAAYLNRGVVGSGLDAVYVEKLERLKAQYAAQGQQNALKS